MARQVLVIEDNRDLADVLSLHLSDIGCEVKVMGDGMAAFHEARGRHYDLIILDLMLPGMDGIELCKRLRQQDNRVPILMLTAKSSELDRVLGLEIGADDYMTKPFSMAELLARVKVIFRRQDGAGQGQTAPAKTIAAGALAIDVAKRRVSVAGKAVDLTAKEFDLLVAFAENPGKVWTRAQLLEQVWGPGFGGYEHTVNSHINRLRAKIEPEDAEPRYILTVWGVGYKFNDELGD
ncbi:MAG: response regulator transcription factor [Alphaproteobacteria bacterium]|nr:response regulator transcription factor [Alphaproteobacteria bacterium]